MGAGARAVEIVEVRVEAKWEMVAGVGAEIGTAVVGVGVDLGLEADVGAKVVAESMVEVERE